MTTLIDLRPAGSSPEPEKDSPRAIRKSLSVADRIFRWGSTGIGTVVLVVTGAVGLFLGYQLIPTLHTYGLHFFTQTQWDPETNVLGIAEVLLGTVEVAIIAVVFAFPLSLLTALYISEYAPWWLRGFLIAMVDLMAAIPSILFAMWGVFLINDHAAYVSRWLNEFFGWVPFFHVSGGEPRAAVFILSLYTSSPAIAGMVVAMMVIPLATAVMLGVFGQAPLSEREGAYALGSTRWGMIQSVVLPFGRGGIVGGTMLALGRALGETVAVSLILSQNFDVKLRPLEIGGITTAKLIANYFNESSSGQLSALLAAGFVLFAITILVNSVAAVIVSRGRSGAQTEI
ncbi:MAG TPA: phosphate ABC transporter permease subunit PstC [Streptosporangiaceae bacterium]|jgi:phosphate transport system permease protein